MLFDRRDIKVSESLVPSCEAQRFIRAGGSEDTLWPFVSIVGYVGKLDCRVREVQGLKQVAIIPLWSLC